MRIKENISLTSCKNGHACKIVAVLGDKQVKGRLEALGIRKGKELIKKTQQPGNGPVIVVCGNFEIAIGYELAQNVIVNVEV